MIVSTLLWVQEYAEDHQDGFADCKGKVEDNQGTENGYRVKPRTTRLLLWLQSKLRPE